MRQILETSRLLLREMTEEDFPALCGMLQDPEVMYAYEHAFSDQEAREWRRDGFGLWAMVEKAEGRMVDQCGLTWQDWDGLSVPEVGYLLQKACWHRGYATEAARACRDFAFDVLHMRTVYSIIRENNLPSRRVAEHNGMTVRGVLVKHYYGMNMPHLVYGIDAEQRWL